MTPANIVGMAALKELDAIALTDHNSSRNCEVTMRLGEEYGIIVLPGMELTTTEEVHVLCLFAELVDALAFDAYVYDKLIKIRNNSKIFGRQIIVDEEERVLYEEENLLIQATKISFDEVYDLTKRYRGIMIPAHIDKNSNSLLSNLGFIPAFSNFTCVELKDAMLRDRLMEKHAYLRSCKCISNSDAHSLGKINEAVNYLHVHSKSRRDILRALETEQPQI